MSYQREPFFPCKISQLLDAQISNASGTTLLLNPITNTPFAYIKLYGLITDKVIEGNEEANEFTIYFLKIDDGTGSLWIKGNNQSLKDVSKWDFVQVIGSTLIEVNDSEIEIVINPDAVVVMEDKTWELVHNQEVLAHQKKSTVETKRKPGSSKVSSENINKVDNDLLEENIESSNEVEESGALESLSNQVESILRQNDSGDGVEFSQILKLLPEANESEIDDILFELAYEGKVYQPRPDYYKIMD